MYLPYMNTTSLKTIHFWLIVEQLSTWTTSYYTYKPFINTYYCLRYLKYPCESVYYNFLFFNFWNSYHFIYQDSHHVSSYSSLDFHTCNKLIFFWAKHINYWSVTHEVRGSGPSRTLFNSCRHPMWKPCVGSRKYSHSFQWSTWPPTYLDINWEPLLRDLMNFNASTGVYKLSHKSIGDKKI